MLILPVVYNSGIRLYPNPPSWPVQNWDDKDYDGAVNDEDVDGEDGEGAGGKDLVIHR